MNRSHPHPVPPARPPARRQRSWLRPPVSLVLLPVVIASGGCVDEDKSDEPMTALEELETVQAAVNAQRTEATAGEVIELTTDFTIGEGYEAAAESLRDWLESQLPCSTVTVGDADGGIAQVHMDLGPPSAEGCAWRGRTWSGALSISLVSVDPAGAVVLEHEWIELSDGIYTLDGAATVTWDGRAGPTERQVEYAADWTSEAGVLSADGALTHAPLDGETFETGFVADGERDWIDEEGRAWALRIEGVEARWLDPVPQAGEYRMTHPTGKEATLRFTRVDEDTIRLTLSGGAADRVFDVSRLGVVEEVE